MAKSILDRFQVALITGGSGGLGKKMAANLISHGKKIIIAGRSVSSLDAAAKDLGPNVVGKYAIDVGKIATLPAFVEKVIKEHPEVDCVINNAGIQKLMNYTETIDTSAVEQEININVTSLAIMCALFASHLLSKPSAVLMNTASGLAYVPRAASPVYSATKAFVLSFTQSLRVQFDKTSVTVVEISPPLVETELTRDQPDPSANKVANNKMSITQDQFMKEVEDGWLRGDQQVAAGFVVKYQSQWRDTYEARWKMANGMK